MKIRFTGALLGSLFILVACNNVHHSEAPVWKEVVKPTLGEEEAKVEAPKEALTGIEKGKHIWTTTCIQCHNADPNIKGKIGPETVDAPLEVMTAKVMTGLYPDPLPAGFVPKRKTRAMRKLPQFKDDIPDIWAYVQSVKKK
jgi:mono/diheme cytochrome c family protein